MTIINRLKSGILQIAVILADFMLIGMIFAENISENIEDGLYRDHVI